MEGSLQSLRALSLLAHLDLSGLFKLQGDLEDLSESPLEELRLNGCIGINGSLSDFSSSWLTAWSRLSTLGLAELHQVTGELQELQG